MAFLRFANAVAVQPQISSKGWSKVRKASLAPSKNLIQQASEILGEPFDPSRYILSHCTIVCSVDTETVPNVKLGRIKVGSKTINRKYADYLITPETDQFINNNLDAWSRNVLLASYKTFIGAGNFLEHVQIEEQSKGRVIDAVARDIGDSVYVDILIATDRKHEQLASDILSGRMGTLSMGCSVQETQCTKCGNVAVDETELCECIRYSKGNYYIDDTGVSRRIAELCGHPSLSPTAGVTFIDASWVRTPAFTGAVLRNVIEPSRLPASMAKRVQAVLQTPPKEWDANAQQKTATMLQAADEDVSWDGADDVAAPTDAPAGDKPKDQPLDKLVDDVYQMIQDRVKERAEKDIQDKEKEKALQPEDSSMWQNESIRKEAALLMAKKAYKGSLESLLRIAKTDIAFVEGLASLNPSFGIHIGQDVYRAVLNVGPINKFASMDRYLLACRQVMGRSPTPAEFRVMARIGKLLTRMGSTISRPQER